MSSNSVCNHTRDKQIGLPLRGRPILLSLVWLQTELDSIQSYYHYVLKIYLLPKPSLDELYTVEPGGEHILNYRLKVVFTNDWFYYDTNVSASRQTEAQKHVDH